MFRAGEVVVAAFPFTSLSGVIGVLPPDLLAAVRGKLKTLLQTP